MARIADIGVTLQHGAASEGLLRGQNGLMHVRQLLTQHFLAVAADFLLRCSLRRGSDRSMLSISVDFKLIFRRTLHELSESATKLPSGRIEFAVLQLHRSIP